VADELVTDPPLPAEPAAEPALPAGGTPGASDPRWGRIVERIKLRKTYLATLLAEVKRVELEDGVLALGFEPGQHFHHGTVSDPRNHAILIEEVRREFGPGVRIEVRQGGVGMRESPGAPAAPRGPAPARTSSGVERLVERFGGVILD
jgi:hypothetical protein